MPRSQIGLQSDRERRVLHALVKLKQVRMCFANADPDNLHVAFRRKCPDALDRQKKRAKFYGLKFFTERKIDIFAHVGKKPEGQVHLIGRSPANAVNVRIKIGQNFSKRLRRIDRNEEPVRLHLAGCTSRPDFASSPLLLVRAGKHAFTSFMV